MLALSIALLAAIGVFLVVRDLCEPYRVRGDLETQAIRRAFWQQNSGEADLVCVKSDLGLNFQPHLWKRGMSAVYLFHRGMFARPPTAAPPRWNSRLADVRRAARLVFFDELPRGRARVQKWLALDWLLLPNRASPAITRSIRVSQANSGCGTGTSCSTSFRGESAESRYRCDSSRSAVVR